MKIKHILFALLMITMGFSASAYTILISGGGRHNQYYRVFANDNRVECTGSGHNSCLISTSGGGYSKTTWHSFSDVVDYVLEKVNNGMKDGDVMYENDLPVQWKSMEDDMIEINIQEIELKGVTQYEAEG